jgi:hypothetical protein
VSEPTLAQRARLLVFQYFLDHARPFSVRPSEWWADIITTCSNTMVFFCSPAQRDASGLAASEDKAASLSPELTHRLSVPLYGTRLRIDYERPSRDELNAHFASLGLAQPYWRI